MAKRIIYADHAATTPLSISAQLAMKPFLESDFYNPSTKYAAARNARHAVEEARKKIADCINALPEEIYFTSGGTEADNWAIKGIAFRYLNQRKKIVASQIEHHAVLNSCAFLERIGYVVEYVPVNATGLVDEECFEKALTQDTVLASVMLVNNEIGTIEPIAKLTEFAHRHNVLFHTDAVQALGNIHVDVRQLDVDMLSASAHKFGGPKGTGFLYVKKGIELEALLSGGGQESWKRAGTENVASIVGMAAALEAKCKDLSKEIERLKRIRKSFIDTLCQTALDYRINAAPNTHPGTISLSIRGINGELLLHRLDLMGIQVATGSACDSKENQLSHVIKALRIPMEYASGTIRISFGEDNEESDAVEIVRAIEKICKK